MSVYFFANIGHKNYAIFNSAFYIYRKQVFHRCFLGILIFTFTPHARRSIFYTPKQNAQGCS